MIGADFEKIHFVIFGLELVEPMAFITDVIMGGVSIVLAWKMSRFSNNSAFYTYWRWFFILFGLGSLFGAFGHTFYNQLGTMGKFPSWISGPLAVYCLEQGMISIFPNRTRKNQLKLFSTLKLIVVLGLFFTICIVADLNEKPTLPFLPIAINTILGVTLTAGILGSIYAKQISAKFKYFYFGVIVMFPSAFIFLLKINLHQWFDKNDLSHVLLTSGIIYFYFGVKKVMPILEDIRTNE